MESTSIFGEALRALFIPAIALLNRVSYTMKFTLLWLLSLLAIAVAAQELFVNLDKVIQPSQRQIEGLSIIKPISQVIQAVQLHRGASAAMLGGSQQQVIRDTYSTKEIEASRALEALENKLPPSLARNGKFLSIKADWQQLRAEGLTWNSETNFIAHTRLIEQLRLLQSSVADEYLLTLDPEFATYYLIDTTINKLPRALEQLGELRAYGTGTLAKKQITDRQKIELHNLIAALGTSLNELKVSLDKTAQYNPALQDSVSAVSADISSSAQLITNLVVSNIITGNFAESPVDFLNTATAEIDKSYAQMYDSLLPTTEALIRSRIAQARRTLYVNLGIAFLAFLLVIYFSVSMYYAVIGSVKSLTRSARSFADGNLQQRIKSTTSDELGQIGNSFNDMAEGFNAMLDARIQAETSLRKESHKNEMLLRAASDGIHILDLEGNVVQVNDTFCKMLGYTPAELSTMNAARWDAQMTAEQIKAKIAELNGGVGRFETRHRCRDGRILDVEINFVKVVIDEQDLVYCSSRDITERKRAERALIESQGRFHAVIETALDAVVQMDSGGMITGWNSQAEKIFGWSKADVIGRPLHEKIIPPQYRDAHLRGLEHFRRTGEGLMLNQRVEIAALHRDNREFPVELTIAPIISAGKYEFSAFIRDITKRKESEDLIWKQANFDILTGLPNRHMFYDRLTQEMKKAQRAGLKMALLFVDLDKFKEINDALGHAMGDLMLKDTARRISECVRETDIVARLGGDEFTVALAELADASSVERVAESILRKLAEPFRLGDNMAYATASIGITLYPVDAVGADDLLKNADQAMYMAKNKGRNRFCYFTPSMQQAAQTRVKLISELRVALSENQFVVYYQPIVELATGRIDKAEALIRWQHPRLGLVNPAQFIHLAEETGLIVEIGDWIFRESARQLKRWRSLYNTELQFSLNVSPVQFDNTDGMCKAWLSHLQNIDLAAQSLLIEITEGLLLKAESGATDKLLGFRDGGIQIAIDDFGTGYSAMSYLKKFDIDYLKIDQSFVRDLESDPDDVALCEAIIMMAHKLGLKVVAEGVETEKQRRLLADSGCDYAQGYLFARPLPADEFEGMLKAQRG